MREAYDSTCHESNSDQQLFSIFYQTVLSTLVKKKKKSPLSTRSDSISANPNDYKLPYLLTAW